MKRKVLKYYPLVFLFIFGTLSLVTAQSKPCTMSADEIKPVIERFNPFFTDHSWDDKKKTEIARLDASRLLVIKQKACTRHHILFTLYLDSNAIQDNDKFWVTEVLIMMKRVYFNDLSYLGYKKEFEVEFIKNFLANGINTLFNFPVNERTFICKIESGDWGAKIKLEVVRFIIVENVKNPGIDRKKDTGWFLGS